MIAIQPLVSLTLVDSTQSAGRLRVNVRSGTSVSDAMGAADELRLLLSGISGCTIVAQSITYRFKQEFPSSPAGSGDMERVIVIIMATETQGQYVMMTVPHILDSMLEQEGDTGHLTLDILNPDVQALLVALSSGIWCNPFGYDAFDYIGSIAERRL